ncbi:MAG: glycosyltransferase [Aigarchaeota archaeon]|nr:glycosyltransferase [Aigarchaeota archaeon]MDW8092658.1 glycosyltransferase [Nitrososphaerota archaeon]
MYVSIVIPTINEAQNIPVIFERIKNTLKGYKYEIVVVDDNSSDDTVGIATSLGAKVIKHDFRRGVGYSVMEGAVNSRGDIVVIMDADGSHDPAILPNLVRMVEDKYDVAKASRFIHGGHMEERVISTVLFNIIAKMLLNIKVNDITGGYLAAKKECFNIHPFFNDGRWILWFMFSNRTRKIIEVPYIYRKRVTGYSKYGGIKHLKRGFNYFSCLIHLLMLRLIASR